MQQFEILGVVRGDKQKAQSQACGSQKIRAYEQRARKVVKQEDTTTCAFVRRLNVKNLGRVKHRDLQSTAAVHFVFVASGLGQAGDGACTE